MYGKFSFLVILLLQVFFFFFFLRVCVSFQIIIVLTVCSVHVRFNFLLGSDWLPPLYLILLCAALGVDQSCGYTRNPSPKACMRGPGIAQWRASCCCRTAEHQNRRWHNCCVGHQNSQQPTWCNCGSNIKTISMHISDWSLIVVFFETSRVLVLLLARSYLDSWSVTCRWYGLELQ